jgi:diguanylate cyclase (GGDEF)-like protein
MRQRVPQLSLLVKFSLLSLLAIGLMGAALAHVLKDQIRERAAADAERMATRIANDLVDQHVTRPDLEFGLSDEHLRSLDQSIDALVLRGTIRNAKLFNARGEVVYSLDRSEIGTADEGASVRPALAGQVHADFEESEDGEEGLYEIYVPLRLLGDRRPVGVFELYLPYRPIQARIDEDTRNLYLVLVAGLALLELLLFPIVGRASRTLRRHAEESRHQALHDDLTGIANRRQLLAALGRAVERAGSRDGRFALLMFDLDRFKEVNDALGHGHGDMLLREVATRLQATVRAGDLLARLGGDEFALLLDEVDRASAAVEIADRVSATLAEEFVLADVPLVVEASIGIALFPDHAEDGEGLLQAADMAMYAAKRGGTSVEVFRPERDRRESGSVARLAELRRAIADGELVLHYQPKVDLQTGEVTGVEALVRWQHPVEGLLAPMEFLPLAERTALVGPLTTWVLEAALAQCAEWRAMGLDVPVAVNVSERSLHDRHFPREVGELLERADVEGSRLHLELTERGLIADLPTAMDVIERLHALGVRLSIDDFGTGYSSLARLLELPIQELKIDRSIVRDMERGDSGAAIVRSTIDLGHHLDLEVVAEGVESETTLRELRRLGCDAAQGYFLLRPQPAADVSAWLRERASSAAAG